MTSNSKIVVIFLLIACVTVLAQFHHLRKPHICGADEFKCKYGNKCIPAAGRCNGSVECKDGSDETFVLCRNNTCPELDFRCTYGACMNSTVRCDGKKDCADNSDEVIPLCRNDFTDFNICTERLIDDRQYSRSVDCNNLRLKCDNGQVLKEPTRCDGHIDCEDGSDETLARCAEAECVPPLFRCAYGGCAFPKAACDGIEDCADGSDESFELCGRVLPSKTTTTPKPVCTLPPPPQNGSYTMGGTITGVPGQTFPSFMLKFTCDEPYEILGASTLFCFDGQWTEDVPTCVRFCNLPKHPTVQYLCQISDEEVYNGYRECEEKEPEGTVVDPQCRPVYYYPGNLRYMRCVDGEWDQLITCIPECGRLGTPADALLLGSQGREARRNELPWHVAIYRRADHRQICSGTIVKNDVVISAAHCFWNKRDLHPASNYVVAAGKLYRRWNHPNDTHVQTSDIREISVPVRFLGSDTNFQDDIALVKLVSRLEYSIHVRPVCIDFDFEFDSRQLKVFSVGKIAGWGRTATGNFSEILKVADVPYVSIQDCISDTPEGFRVYITSDKICAGYKNGTALCEGDSGGGLTFPARERGTIRYYLRGVASTAVNNQRLCNEATITSFTHVVTHARFIQEHL
nr:modular serine protease-like [Helicoverpa armigera]